MINLLPHDYKQDIAYARQNLRLRNWIIASLVALAGVGVIVAGGFIYLENEIYKTSSQIKSSEAQLAAQNMGETQKRVNDISSNTKLATQVLSREVLFSKLIKQIGTTLPSNTALESLEIDNAETGVQLNASAIDFNAATQIQVNLQDPKNGVFEKADINNITCGGDTIQIGEKKATFPCKVELRALFSKNNSYLYIAPAQKGGGN